jgi:2-polyprenyl-3-methyl-5-hydroxy-6-metoxy-1,4-benzoquinol methylase
MQKAKKNIAPPCDCCGGLKWEYRFSENGFDLGCCTDCGLHYLSEVPLQKSQTAEVKEDRIANNRNTKNLKVCKEAELSRRRRFHSFCRLIQKSAPKGKWLDIGCGTGALIEAAMELGIDIEGVEPMPVRRELASRLTGAVIHDRQIELLDIMPASFAAVTLTDVFSHLSSPMTTLSNIHCILKPGGILLLYTSEIGAGVTRHHNYLWDLGDHRYYLGEHTIERYADNIGFEVIHREKEWAPELLYSRENLLATGRSTLRNVIKKACVYTPGVLKILRWYMLKIHNRNNPHYVSTLLLKKKTRK